MLEVYVDYVICYKNKKGTRATIHLSTERGEKGEIKVSENGIDRIEFMTKYLSRYADGLYSKSENRFVALADYDDSLTGYEPYHLNYCPQYIEREFRGSDPSISGYTFGSMNPLYGGKVKCNWTNVEYQMEDNGTCFVMVSLYDSFGSFVDVYPGVVAGTEPMQCVLQAIKEVAEQYYYCLEEGIWDIRLEKDEPTGTCYDIDLEYNEQDILDLEFRKEE